MDSESVAVPGTDFSERMASLERRVYLLVNRLGQKRGEEAQKRAENVDVPWPEQMILWLHDMQPTERRLPRLLVFYRQKCADCVSHAADGLRVLEQR